MSVDRERVADDEFQEVFLTKLDKLIAVLERIAEAIEEEIAMAQAEENDEQ